ncbi:oxygenase MpaB family protein [Algoriphagus marincola]|uniref:oxygenase MpaB family protein n=1 Tax=Algoriphagus marincola TaxID=264027 RepID=UPI00040341C0|nr:oxygenase MpaB family protein [Algoriphagus marincola]
MDKLKLYTNQNFDQLRQRQDPLADQAVEDLIANPKLIDVFNSWDMIPDQLSLDFSPRVRNFLQFYFDKLSLGETSVLQNGQAFFAKNGDIYLGLLGFYSLPYCYAFGDGAEVLVRSKRIVQDIGKRLAETGVFVMDIFRPNAFISDSRAYLTCAKVRLIHAFSRYFIQKYARDWDPKFGKAINQEDMLGTNLAFSMIVLRGMIKMGRNISESDFEAVLQYWKWIGELIGVDTSYWPENSKEAFELDRLIRKRHLKSTEAGKTLIGALGGYYKGNIPDALIRQQVDGLFYFFLGKEASNALGVKSTNALPGNLVDLVFRFSGLKNYGSKKSYESFRRMMEIQQKEKFGEVIKLNLPQVVRS